MDHCGFDQLKGLSIRTPVPVKSGALRVTIVMPC